LYSKMMSPPFKSWVIATAPVGIAAAAGIAQKNEGPASLRDFGDTPFVILDSRWQPNYLQWVRPIFRQTGFKPAQTLKVNSAEAFFALLRAGAGVALLGRNKAGLVRDS
jgi:DNA-binding transcriptional LysR family regulator